MALIGLFVPADAPWLSDLRSELLAFPTGRHDDQVDALGLCGQLMDKFNPGHVRGNPIPTRNGIGADTPRRARRSMAAAA